MGMGSSKPAPPPPVAAPPPPKEPEPEEVPEKKEALKFGWEEKVYKGAYKQSKSTLQRQLTQIDEMAIWRLEARSMRLMEIFDEASDAISQRPAGHQSRFPPGLDLNEKVEQACHRQCIEVWQAFDRCKAKKGGSFDNCSGWFGTYMNCADSCVPRLSLQVLEAMAMQDPDPNMDRLGR